MIPEWAEALGIEVTPAPVVIRFYNPSRPSEEDTEAQIIQPGPLNVWWLTSEIPMPEEFGQEYSGLAVVGRNGERSNMGIAVPYEPGRRDPFIFLWSENREGASIDHIIEDENIEVEELGVYGEVLVTKLGHKFFSHRQPQEWYLVLQYDSLREVSELIVYGREKLVSGSGVGKAGRRLSLFDSPELPFEYFLGFEEPGLHQLGKMGRRILGR
jgi:hypothetical protein